MFLLLYRMEKIIILLLLSVTLFARQVVLVVAEDFNATKGTLSCMEDGKVICHDISVNLGRNGLAWGIGILKIAHDPKEPVKKEGDGKAPAGVFALTEVFGYGAKSKDLKMPYVQADKDLICVDDRVSPNYNKLVYGDVSAKSFEQMRRDDNLYSLGVVVGHNPRNLRGRGSCIFLHIERFSGAPTAGCTSMSYEDLQHIVRWLDAKKQPVLIQVTRKYLPFVTNLL